MQHLPSQLLDNGEIDFLNPKGYLPPFRSESMMDIVPTFDLPDDVYVQREKKKIYQFGECERLQKKAVITGYSTLTDPKNQNKRRGRKSGKKKKKYNWKKGILGPILRLFG